MSASFSQKVYSIVSRIPRGKVITYGEVAKRAGNPRVARAVGMCVSKNIDTHKVSCHRAVTTNGVLTGYAFGGVKTKKRLLQKEGVVFVGDRVSMLVCSL